MHRPRALRTLLAGAVSVAVVASMAVAANADDQQPTPTDTPSATDTPTDGTSPSGEPTDVPTAEPSDTPTDVTTPSETPSSEPSQGAKAAVKPPPDRYTPKNAVFFNYPYAKSVSYQDANRGQVYRSINATNAGAKIRIAMFSINDNSTVNALIAARNRGVSVQVVVNQHNVKPMPNKTTSPSFIKLMKTLGSNINAHGGKNADEVSWAKYCYKSCRGKNGNVHQKMILISRAGGADGAAAKKITMMGSPNLTMLAARGQMNHNNVFIDTDEADGYPMYTAYNLIFRQMAKDMALKTTFVSYTNKQIPIATWFYPNRGNTAGRDPLLKQMAGISCKGGTVVRIGMYAWFDDHGNYMAKRVRQLWDQGCNVAITTAILGNTVKKTLLSSSGRGRIPMRQIATYDSKGNILTYNHSKYIAVAGTVDGKKDQYRVWTGTVNWTNLGWYSDEGTQVYTNGSGDYGAFAKDMYFAYYANYKKLWSGPHSFAPSPGSSVTGDIGDKKANKLGAGKYANVEEN